VSAGDGNEVLVNVPYIVVGPEGWPLHLVGPEYYRFAAKEIRHQANVGQPFAGANVTEAVAKLCDNAADALDALGGAS
jgi:hypothetical protein